MRTMMTAWLIAAFLVAMVIAVGCEDTPLTAGKDFTMGLVASPSTVIVDPVHDIDSATSTILATVTDAEGVPQSGLTVYFTTSGGALAAGINGVQTNGNGVASDTLTVGASDANTITVTATSAALSEDVTVTKSGPGINHAPVATIEASPVGEQAVGRAVTFNGSASSDVDPGDSIVKYKWTVTSSAPDAGWTNPFVLEGPTATLLTFPTGFTNPQTLSVLLTVTDSNNVNGASTPLTYPIKAQVCSDNTKPTARIAGGATLHGAVGTTVTFVADGATSSDPETAIQTYTWNCGAGGAPVSGSSPTTTCSYVVAAASSIYTVTLLVTDQGFGAPAFTCAQTSTAATVQVTVGP